MARSPSFASRFPGVARLLSSMQSSTADAGAAPPDAEEEEEEQEEEQRPQGSRGSGSSPSATSLQKAFERDAAKLVQDERDRWNAVLESKEGKANAGMARRLLNKTEMSSEDIVDALGEDGGKEADADAGRGRETSASARQGRERLQGARGIDRDTGGGGDSERAGARDTESVEERRERRRTLQENRNRRTAGGRGGQRPVAGGTALRDRDDDRGTGTRR